MWVGMVGYPESITDPSYQGQILVITFPLVGNYGVPPRDTILDELPAYFESSRIHIAGLVVATYTEEYSHYLANGALGDWLKEQGIPGIWGVDTRALTKRIRVNGSMLGRLRQESGESKVWEDVEWQDPNVKNLVAEGTPRNYAY
jgi:carbamoyl-phosphate synthase/aspartate carbamoyltransferase